jgi:hypothetical protein
MKGLLSWSCIIFFSLILGHCGRVSPTAAPKGSLDMHLWIDQTQSIPTALGKTEATTWNRIMIEVTAADFAGIKDTFSVESSQQWLSAHIDAIPAGKDRRVTCWSINARGDTIHGSQSSLFDLEAGQSASVTMQLSAIRGSIYFTLSLFPASVDSVKAAFVTPGRTWSVAQKKATKMFLSLDDIPFGSTGRLWIAGFNAAGDTVAAWSKDPCTLTGASISLTASFVTVGGLRLDLLVSNPGVTIISGIMDTTATLAAEKGGLIVSEIMYTANDSEYIELHNPTTAAFADSFYVQIDNGAYMRFFAAIAAKGFFVIGRAGRDSLAWVDTCPASLTALDLLSGGGNWIIVRAKDSTVLDRVAYEGGTNMQEWPSVSGKRSIVLDSLAADPLYNNFGRHWQIAQSKIDTGAAPLTQQYGTPGRAGL